MRSSGCNPFGRTHGVRHKHCDRHWPNTARNWSDSRCDLTDGFEVNISDEPISPRRSRIVDAIHTDVDDYGAWTNHVCTHETGATCGNYKDVGALRMGGEIAGMPVTNRYRPVRSDDVLHQQRSHRLADDVTAPNYDALSSG